MQRPGKNINRYCGETIDIQMTLQEIETAARKHDCQVEEFFRSKDVHLIALHRPPRGRSGASVYLSAGIHGDEPAGPLAALRLLQENAWPANLGLWLCPCLNPVGFTLNRRENEHEIDLNRDYRHFRAAAVHAHAQWLARQPGFDVTFCLHEDWEAKGFYLYELNPEHRPSASQNILAAIAPVCPIDMSPVIEGREASGGIISPNFDPASRPEWPEAFWLLQNKTRLSYTLEAPSDFLLQTRVNALVAGVNAALASFQ